MCTHFTTVDMIFTTNDIFHISIVTLALITFQLSARSEREARALEVCEMMTEQHTLQLAIKYSSRMQYMQLAQRLSKLASEKAEEEEAKQAVHRYG